MEKDPLFAEVIIPVTIAGTLTYAVPPDLSGEAEPGKRVLVQLGKKKIYAGIIAELHYRQPEKFEAKPLLSILDDTPLLTESHIRFWRWIASYYMATPGDVMHAALPQGLRLQSETVYRIEPGFHKGRGELSLQEEALLDTMEEDGLQTLEDLRKSVFGNEGVRIARRLIDRGALVTHQQLKERYSPKTTQMIALSPRLRDEKKLVELIDGMKRAPAQANALEEYARLSGIFLEGEEKEVPRGALTGAGISSNTLQALIKKDVFLQYEKTVSRIRHSADTSQLQLPATLTEKQRMALESIRKLHKEMPVVLLHGVTSSGKTELYIHLIEEQVKQGKQVLYLMPEIAITTQIISRLKKIFGERVGVYHSRYSDAERVEFYLNIAGHGKAEPFDIVLGVRSALFLPFRKLGLIIIDEEHEHTYKQTDPAPRYHARDAATIAGVYYDAKLVFGSATPSFESMYNARTKKYGLVELDERFGRIDMPEIIIADTMQARKRKQMRSYFTPELIAALDETIEKGKQAILFQNRRGFANYLQCTGCGFILTCTRCDVSMTYHKHRNRMVCHYCGNHIPVPGECPDCHESSLIMRGFGTEKIEDELALIYPDLSVDRLDLDRIHSRKGFERVLGAFESGRTQVLIGTQLVTKGLDFENVHLVGVVDADSMMHFPDFRAFERSFQVMMQVSGRSGRRKERGKVVIQTTDPTHPVIQCVLDHDYESLYREQMAERKMFRYPPFVRLIRLTLRHEISSILEGGASFLAGELKEIFGNRVLGPQQPVVARTHGKHIRQIVLKIEKESSFERARQLTAELLEIFALNPVYKQINVSVDVDPLS
jgi:primosomal protein N' (replication factor Y)